MKLDVEKEREALAAVCGHCSIDVVHYITSKLMDERRHREAVHKHRLSARGSSHTAMDAQLWNTVDCPDDGN